MISNFAYGQTGQFMGKVVDNADKYPIPGVTVTVFLRDTLVATTTTDFDGNFHIENLTVGIYDATAQGLGFKEEKINGLTIHKGQISFFDFVLFQIPIDSKKVIVWKHISFRDSLGNFWCIDATTNQLDSLGRKQGLWEKRFMDYQDDTSGYKIGQLLWMGKYKDDKKDGEWTYYSPDGTIEKKEIYIDGHLIENKK